MSGFKVVVNTMIEAGRERYFVTIYHPERPADAKPWDEGRMDVYDTFIEENAKFERDSWQEFFDYPKPKGIREVY